MKIKPSHPWTWLIIVIFSSQLMGENQEKIHELHRDIILLNLVNGLYLTNDQMESLMEKIDAAERARESFWDELSRRDREVEGVLQDVRSVLLKGEEIPEDLKKRVHQMKEIQHRLEDERGVALIELEADVEALLTPNQLLVLKDYKACTIPPAQGKIGQSVESGVQGMVRMLTRIRSMPRDRYELTRDMFIDFHLDKIERHLGFNTPEKVESYRRQMLNAFQEVRSMNDQNFLVQKAEIAKTLMPEEIKPRNRKKNQLTKTGHFLLDPALKSILQNKMKDS